MLPPGVGGRGRQSAPAFSVEKTRAKREQGALCMGESFQIRKKKRKKNKKRQFISYIEAAL
jgi:hypothetical protein